MNKIIISIMSLLLLTTTVYTQTNDPGKGLSSTYLIKNATVVQKPGVVLQNTSILVKNGLISDIGKDIKAPFDAIIVNADSMFIYPGLIDAYSNYGLPKEEEKKDQPRVADPGNPPADRAGITPQLSMADKLNAKDNSLMDLKKEGFSIVNVAPKNGMLPGSTNLLLLNEHSSGPVVKRDVASVFQYTGARGVYPSTNIAVISKFREMMKNAQLSDQHLRLYAANPSGIERPVVSDEVGALIPVVRKEKSLMVPAKNIRDVFKSLSLQKDLGFNLILTDAKIVLPAIDDIKKSKTQLVLSLELPKPEEVKKEEKAEKKDTDKKESDKQESDKKESEEKSDKKKVEEPDSPEIIALKERKKKAYDEHLQQSVILEKNGVNFSFAVRDLKAKDIRKNIKTLVDAGLSENTALAALTVNPANLLGISNVAGTLERGKMANLFITDKHWLDEKSKVRFVMVDGKLEALEEKKEKPKSNGEAAGDISGVYNYEVNAMGQTNTGVMTITKSGTGYKVKLDFDGGAMPSTESDNVDVSGNNVNFSINMQMGPQSVSLDYNLLIDGSDMKGDINVGDFGSFPVKGKKIDPKN